MSSKTQISCAGARLSAALEPVWRRTVRLFKKSLCSKQQTLSTSSTLKEGLAGTWAVRSLGLFSGIPWRASVKSLGKERSGALEVIDAGAQCLETPDSLERLFLCCALVLCCFPPRKILQSGDT